MMWKRLKSKGTKWDCHQICQMHIQSMENQDHYFLVLKSVSKINQSLLLLCKGVIINQILVTVLYSLQKSEIFV